jgi:hypothetical protein
VPCLSLGSGSADASGKNHLRWVAGPTIAEEISAADSLIHLWHGKDDRNISWKYSEQISALLPQVTTHWLEEEGHYSLPITHSERIVKQALGKE